MIPVTANFRFPFSGGILYGYISEKGLQKLHLYPDAMPPPAWTPLAPCLRWGRRLHELLEQYFSGCRTDFSAIPLDLGAGTAFQQRVWHAACTIQYGNTTNYGTLAREAGVSRAARAVGAALGANPIILIVPCHRVIASDGSLGGYGPGLQWKRRFLALEPGMPWGDALRAGQK